MLRRRWRSSSCKDLFMVVSIAVALVSPLSCCCPCLSCCHSRRESASCRITAMLSPAFVQDDRAASGKQQIPSGNDNKKSKYNNLSTAPPSPPRPTAPGCSNHGDADHSAYPSSPKVPPMASRCRKPLLHPASCSS